MAKPPARKPSAGFMKPMTPSAALAAIIGAKPVPRTEVTKRLWIYIKKNGLQDPKDKRTIIADAALKVVPSGAFGIAMLSAFTSRLTARSAIGLLLKSRKV